MKLQTNQIGHSIVHFKTVKVIKNKETETIIGQKTQKRHGNLSHTFCDGGSTDRKRIYVEDSDVYIKSLKFGTNSHIPMRFLSFQRCESTRELSILSLLFYLFYINEVFFKIKTLLKVMKFSKMNGYNNNIKINFISIHLQRDKTHIK